MTSDEKLQQLQNLMAAFFLEARRRQKDAGLETKRSGQVTHDFDFMIDVICDDLGLANPGTDKHSLKVWPHPIRGYSPDTVEIMRRERVRQGIEKAVPSDAEWLRLKGYRIKKNGWVEKIKTRYDFDNEGDDDQGD
jgi:hypothetical protein